MAGYTPSYLLAATLPLTIVAIPAIGISCAVTYTNDTPGITMTAASIAQAFDLTEALQLLHGGEGRTYRAGDII